MTLLTKEQILKHEDLKSEIVPVPEWGGEVRVCTMSGFARDRFEAGITGKSGGANMSNIRAKLAAATIVDEEGNLLFDEADIAKLGKKSCAALDRVFEAAQKLNLITNDDVEVLAKN
jgi:hypothetical protein